MGESIGIPVKSLFVKSDGYKIGIIRSTMHGAVSGQVTTDVQATIKREMPSAVLAIHDLTHDGTHKDKEGTPLVDGKLYPCVGCFAGGGRKCVSLCDRNQIESDIYKPDDQGVNLYETINRAQVVCFFAEARCGGLDSAMQRFLERLNPYRNALEENNRNVLRDKVALCVVVGNGASTVVGVLVSVLTNIGFSIPPQGIVAIDAYDSVEHEVALSQYKKNGPIKDALDQMVENGMRLAKKFNRD